ncbi:hypothetical protein H4R33_005661 [Dimargaris cristalligena]|nr:hypothetical protein H4R33_005661 [Dimargaris cristalligena]
MLPLQNLGPRVVQVKQLTRSRSTFGRAIHTVARSSSQRLSGISQPNQTTLNSLQQPAKSLPTSIVPPPRFRSAAHPLGQPYSSIPDAVTVDQVVAAAHDTIQRMHTLAKDTDFPHLGLLNEFVTFFTKYSRYPGVECYHPATLPLLTEMYTLILRSCQDQGQYQQILKTLKQMYHHLASWVSHPDVALTEADRVALSDSLVQGLLPVLDFMADNRDFEMVSETCRSLVNNNQVGDTMLDPHIIRWTESPLVWAGLLNCTLSTHFAHLPYRRRAATLAYPILKKWHQIGPTEGEWLWRHDIRYHGFANDVDRIHSLWETLPTTGLPVTSELTAEYISALARCGNYRQATAVYEDWQIRFGSPSTIEPAYAIALCHAEYQEIQLALRVYNQGLQAYQLGSTQGKGAPWLTHTKRVHLQLHHAACIYDQVPASLASTAFNRARGPQQPLNIQYMLTLPDTLRQLQDSLQAEGYTFDVFDYHDLTVSLSFCHQVHPRVFPYTAVTTCYDQMVREKVKPNLDLFVALLWNSAVAQHYVLNETQRAARTAVEFEKLVASGLDYATARVYQPLLLSCIPISRVRDLELPQLVPIPFDKIDPRFYQYKADIEAQDIPLDDQTMVIFFYGLAINGDMVALRQQWRGLSIFAVPRNARVYLAILSCLSRRPYWARFALSIIQGDMSMENPPIELSPALRTALLKCCAMAGDLPAARNLLKDIELRLNTEVVAQYDLLLQCHMVTPANGPEGEALLARYKPLNVPWSYHRYASVFYYHLEGCRDYTRAREVLTTIIRYWLGQMGSTPAFHTFLRLFGPPGLLELEYTSETVPERTTDQPPVLPQQFFSTSQENPLPATTLVPEPVITRSGAEFMAFPFHRHELYLICDLLTLYARELEHTHILEAVIWLCNQLPAGSQINFESRSKMSKLGQLLASGSDHEPNWEAALRLLDLIADKLKLPIADNNDLKYLNGKLKERYRKIGHSGTKAIVKQINPNSTFLDFFQRNLDIIIPTKPHFNLRAFQESQVTKEASLP